MVRYVTYNLLGNPSTDHFIRLRGEGGSSTNEVCVFCCLASGKGIRFVKFHTKTLTKQANHDEQTNMALTAYEEKHDDASNSQNHNDDQRQSDGKSDIRR